MAKQKITPAQMLNGLVKQRQGGTTGDATWQTPGTSNTDVSTKNVFIQVGSIVASATSGVDVQINFPVSFTQIPIVISGTASANSSNQYATVNTITTTGFRIRQLTGTSAETLNWIAIGQ
jgi:hypothetical protein